MKLALQLRSGAGTKNKNIKAELLRNRLWSNFDYMKIFSCCWIVRSPTQLLEPFFSQI